MIKFKLCILLCVCALPVMAIEMSLPSYATPGERPSYMVDSPPSNAIGDVVYNAQNGDIWISTGSGLAVSRDGGETWESKLTETGFAALAVLGDWIWAGASYNYPDPNDPNNTLPAGGGFYVSFDGGITFEHCTTATGASRVGQLAYDIAIMPDGADTIVYASCFYGGLIYTKDRGATWQNAFPDGSIEIDYTDLGHRFFSVAVDTSAEPPIVWAGSAKGLYFGREGTFAWDRVDTTGHWIPDSVPIHDTVWVETDSFEIDSVSRYYIVWQRDSLDAGRLSGNWIISLNFLYQAERTGVFACTRYTSTNNAGTDFDAISYSFDGSVWRQTGLGYVAWNMGFSGDTLWAACRHGLSRAFPTDYNTADTLNISGVDRNSGNPVAVLKDEVVSATYCGDALYVGTYSEGLARTFDNGETWEIIANFPSGAEASTQDPNADNEDEEYVYAFPNPYSPRNHESCFFAFESPDGGDVKIELFDYDINKVSTIYSGSVQRAGKSRVQWDGKLENGDEPENGLYFFRLETEGDARWGKLMIIK